MNEAMPSTASTESVERRARGVAAGADLPQPGLIGILIRLLLAGFVGWMGVGAILAAPSFFDGFNEPVASLGYVLPLSIFSSWVVNELMRKQWGWRPTILLLVGLGITVAWGAWTGNAYGAGYGMYVWCWTVLFATLLAPALLLAAILRTPGCEMRSYAHLTAKVTGRDAAVSLCPGWIDRFDSIRLRRRP